MTVRVTGSGLRELSLALEQAGRDVAPEAKKVTDRALFNIKRDWQQRWRGLTALPGLPRTITYDSARLGDTVAGEVGPDHRRGGQATLAHIPEYGLAQKNVAPHPGGAPALEAEAPKYEKHLGELGERLLS